MSFAMRESVTLVWGVLMLATGLIWWAARGDAVLGLQAATIVMVIAAIKVRLIVLYFMELKTAPLALRFLFEGWIVLFTGLILVGYWAGIE